LVSIDRLGGLASAPAAMSATTVRRSATFRSAMAITAPTAATPAPVAEPERAGICHHHRATTVVTHHADAASHGGQESDAERDGKAANQTARLVAVDFSGAGKIINRAAARRRLSWFYFHNGNIEYETLWSPWGVILIGTQCR
jgi:hypothetical protein